MQDEYERWKLFHSDSFHAAFKRFSSLETDIIEVIWLRGKAEMSITHNKDLAKACNKYRQTRKPLRFFAFEAKQIHYYSCRRHLAWTKQVLRDPTDCAIWLLRQWMIILDQAFVDLAVTCSSVSGNQYRGGLNVVCLKSSSKDFCSGSCKAAGCQ